MDYCLESREEFHDRQQRLVCDVCSCEVHWICNTGWHRRLNYRAHGTPPFYMYVLIDLLHREARIAELQVQLVSDGKVRRYQDRAYKTMQTRIFRRVHDKGELSTSELLKAVSGIYGPL